MTKKDSLLCQLDDLKKEKSKLLSEIENFRENTRSLEEEKHSISASYNNLLNLHNQML